MIVRDLSADHVHPISDPLPGGCFCLSATVRMSNINEPYLHLPNFSICILLSLVQNAADTIQTKIQ